MTATLPLQPNLEHLKKQAKDLLKAHQHGDAAVCSTLRHLRHLHHASDAEILAAPLTLRQAQHALARQYGFTNWADLKAAVEAAGAAGTITGGCFCGNVRYLVTEPAPKPTVCHCEGCRRASAAPAVAWITMKAEAFKLLQGELKTVRGQGFPLGTCDFRGERGFCANCGTHITWIGDSHRHEISVTTASLDDLNRFPPTEESFAEWKLAWMKLFVESK